ncbi:MAG: chemotaxis protein CheW [Syntrophobacteraceae bacterium]|nr:chemotaxis protein CheW [Syntrophobacteraceae bacterium]
MATKQFVTFRIDGDLFGMDVLRVREINRILDITPVPRAPVYVRGLVNLRGQTLTVFDLGIRLGLAPRPVTEESHNVVLKQQLVGLLVDSIGNMAQCDELDVERCPANACSIEAKFIDGVVKLEEELLIVLRSEKLLEYAGV